MTRRGPPAPCLHPGIDEDRGVILGTTFTSSGLADWLHAATIAPVGDSRSSVCGIRSLPVPRATKSGSPGSRSARRSGPANTPKTVFTPRTNPTRVGASTALGQPAHTSERRTQRCDGAAMRTLSSLTQRRTSRSGRVSGSQWSRSWPNGRCWRTNYVVCDERAGDRERAAFRCSFPRGAWRGSDHTKITVVAPAPHRSVYALALGR